MDVVAERIEEEPRLALLRKRSLECSSCGYGIARSTPPERCPMCQAVETWTHTPWRPFSRHRLLY
jgi:rubrerythrin